MRQIESDKLKVILALKDSPIVIMACKKAELSTSTFYRWKNEDKRFMREVNRAIMRGRETVSDIAEAQLIKGIKRGDNRNVIFWLKTFRHPYKKQDKSVIEIRAKTVPEKVRRDGVLMPTTPISKNTTSNPKLEKAVEKMANNVLRKYKRERVLMRALAEKGYKNEDIERMLKDVKD